jgi:hypothetical protein
MLSYPEIKALLSNVQDTGDDAFRADCPACNAPQLEVARGERVAVMARCRGCKAKFHELIYAFRQRAL